MHGCPHPKVADVLGKNKNAKPKTNIKNENKKEPGVLCALAIEKCNDVEHL